MSRDVKPPPLHIHILAICFILMILALPFAIYEKLTRPASKDWRDGYNEFKKTIKKLDILKMTFTPLHPSIGDYIQINNTLWLYWSGLMWKRMTKKQMVKTGEKQ